MKKVNFNSCIEYDGKLWFVTHSRYFMYYDIASNEYKAVVPSNISDIQIGNIADNMFCCNNKIYFLEQNAGCLYEYDIVNNYLYEYRLPNIKMVNWVCFACVCIKDDNIYMFTKDKGEIYCFNTNTKKIEKVISDINSDLRCSTIVSDKVYLVSENRIFVYDLNEKKYKTEYSVNISIKKIYYYKGQFYIITNDEEVYLTDEKFDKWEMIYRDDNHKQTIHNIAVCDNKIFIFPCFAGSILSIDKKTYEITEEAVPKDIKYFIPEWSKFYGEYECENRIWIANRQTNYLSFIDKVDEELKWIKVNGCDIKEILPYLKYKNVFEENELDLDEYIKLYVEK